MLRKYDIQQKLGKGAYAVVFKGVDKKSKNVKLQQRPRLPMTWTMAPKIQPPPLRKVARKVRRKRKT